MPIKPERRREILRLILKKTPELIEQEKLEVKKCAEYCKLCILDAFAGRLSSGLASNLKRGKLIFTIFKIQTSEILLNLILFCSVIHSITIFFEPNNPSETTFSIRLLHIFSVLIYIIDVLLKIAYQGVEDYFESDWQRIYACSAALNTLDLVIHGGRTCWFNFLRPVPGLLRSREGRRFFEAVQKMVPIVLESLVPLTLFILVVSIFSSLVFNDHFSEVNKSIDHHYNWFWLILTNDTLDQLFHEKMFENTLYIFFFFSSIYIGQKFLLSLILGATFDTFKSMTENQLKKEKIKELQGLVKAFTSVDRYKTGVISISIWNAIMKELEYSPEEATLYYELISGGSNNLSVYQFLSLKNVLDYTFHMTKDQSSVDPMAKQIVSWIPDYFDSFIPTRYVQKVKELVKKIDIDRLIFFISALNLILVTFDLLKTNLIPFFVIRFLSVYSLIAILLFPKMYSVLISYITNIKTVPLTFDSLEILIDANVAHVAYFAILLKAFTDLIYVPYSDFIGVQYLNFGSIVSLLNLFVALLYFFNLNANAREFITKYLNTSDYILMSIILLFAKDIIFPVLGFSDFFYLIDNTTFETIIRVVSSMQILSCNDSVKFFKNFKEKLSTTIIEVPPLVKENLLKAYSFIQSLMDRKIVEKDANLKDKIEKKDKSDKKEKSEKPEKSDKKEKKAKKKKELKPIDIPRRCRTILLSLDVLLLILDLHDTSLIPFLPFSLITPCRIVSILYLIDLTSTLIKIDGKVSDLFPESIDASNFYIFGTVYISITSLLQLTGLGYIPFLRFLVNPQFLLVGRLIRCLRVIELNNDLSTFLNAISGVTTLFMQQMMFAFVTVYIFAMMGNLLFQRYSDLWANPLASTVTAQKLFLPADFIDITEETMQKSSSLAIVFFITYFFIGLVVCNIALSIVIEWYGDCLNDDGKKAAEKERKSEAMLLEAIKTRAQTRNFLRTMGMSYEGHSKKLNFEGITFSRAQTSDHRSKLVGPLSLTVEDLSNCQKYASIDLVKGYQEYLKTNESKDEAAFIDSFISAEVGVMKKFQDGDIIFSAETAANQGFLFMSGKVKIQFDKKNYSLQPLAFLGFEVLQPNGVYGLTCVSDGPVECLVFEKEDISMNMSDELSGSLLRLAYKTYSKF